ncbi:MAG: fasciclin domain-containing protein [Akkermansiaceae bacterium]|jgi:transforming growth factor-beta-induced protein|tara:strand:+ start:9703 stop:10485 length:783 start_codon:yes stop_codon:yes gene_type:complete
MKRYIKTITAAGVLCVSMVSLNAGTILETASSAGKFTILEKAVKAAGLTDALNGEGPFTVFAPTDEAFMRLPKGTIATLLKPENKAMLVEILTYHVVSGKVEGSKAVTLSEATALNKKKLTIKFKNAALYVNKSKVIATDVMASNGVIHIIDEVLIPAAIKPSASQSSSAASQSAEILSDAISVGVDLFNDGKEADCAKVYKIALRAVVALKPEELDKATMATLNKTLQAVSNEKDARKNAWTLRYAMDKAMKSLGHSED